MNRLEDLQTPALLIDLDKLDANIGAMSLKTGRLGVSLRPHIKTHKCIEIAQLQQEAGARGLTVSTLHEAEVFADHGFTDLTWAFPVIFNRISQALALVERITLRLVIDSREALQALEATGVPLHVWLKVDCGYHRAGVDPNGPLAMELARRLTDSKTLEFDGILTHSGQSYGANSRLQLGAIAEQEREVMSRFADTARAQGVPIASVSVGSTPAMSAVENLQGVDEARPGNYVFYDQTQVDLGACGVVDCAATVLASVVSSQPGADHCVVDAGALALSKDTGSDRREPRFMGGLFTDYEAGVLSEKSHLTSLSQEHGIVSTRLPLNQRVRILPNHSCLTVACFDECVVVRGDQVVDRWRVWNGR